MDPSVLIASAIAVLTPYVKKVGEEFAGEMGKIVAGKAGELLERFKQWFKGDAAASDIIKRFEEQPERYKPALEDHLQERLAATPELVAELNKLISDIKAAGPNVRVVQRLVDVENAIGMSVGEMTTGSVSVEQQAENVTNVTGFKADKLGG